MSFWANLADNINLAALDLTNNFLSSSPPPKCNMQIRKKRQIEREKRVKWIDEQNERTCSGLHPQGLSSKKVARTLNKELKNKSLNDSTNKINWLVSTHRALASSAVLNSLTKVFSGRPYKPSKQDGKIR